MALDLGELYARVTVDTTTADRNLTAFERRLLQAARTNVPDVAVGVDTATGERRLQALEADLVGLPDGDVQVVADTVAAERGLDRVAADTEALPDGDVFVDAAVTAALAELGKIASEVRSLPDGEVTVRAKAEGLDDLADGAGDAGRQAGAEAGEGLSAGVIAAIATIPVAGAIVGIGAAIGESLLDGLQNEVRRDRLLATTGLDEVTVARLGRAAGEAYAGNFGESIESNLDAARVAVQQGLLDPESTARDSQAIIQSLTGVSDILGEDIPRVVRATATLLRSGLVDTADEAFDLLVRGQQNGANAAEDLLDTFTEYPAVLERLGLSGQDALGLISQGLQNGARDSDFVADALKEFQIRATDGSETSAAGFRRLGLDAEETTAKIARGGQDAREGLDEVLDGLRAIEDPVERNAAAVELFGTKAEDLGDSLFALDLDTVAASLGEVEGAAAGAIAALGDNRAGQVESAFRNIELAADGVKGALAEAFGPQLEQAATFVTENREAVVGFLLDVANGAIDVGRTLVEGAAAGTEGFGDFVGSTGPAVLGLIDSILAGLDSIPGVDLGDAREDFAELRATAEESFASFDASTSEAADAIRTNLITNGLDPAQRRLNEVGFDLQTQARFSDSTTALAAAVADIGYAADGTRLAIDLAGGSFDTTSDAGRRLDEQIRSAVDALDAQVVAGRDAGRTQEELAADYDANRAALGDQLEAMGLTEDQAYDLIDAYGAVPSQVQTRFDTPGSPRAADEADRVRSRVEAVPTGRNTTFTANTRQAERDVELLRQSIARIQSKNVNISVATIRTEVNRDAAAAARGGTQPRYVGERANGGPVGADLTYLVGERGPELVTFARDGYVLTAEQSRSLASAAATAPAPASGGRPGDTYDVKVFGQPTPRETAAAIVTKLRIARHEVTG